MALAVADLDYHEASAMVEWVSDDWGNYWAKCDPTCDIEVVRPGKAQCSGEPCDELSGYWPEDDWMDDPIDWQDY